MPNQKNVLVLGWEFPPRMVGGLAIATYGIVEALSKFLQVHLIIPFKDEQTPQIPNVQIYGLNQIELDFEVFEIAEITALLKKRTTFFESSKVYSYPMLDTFGVEIDRNSITNYSAELEENNQDFKSYLDIFKSEEVYGWSLWEKMKIYNELVGALAGHIDFDIIHCHDWVTFNAGKTVKGLYGKPLCLHVHALETDRVGSTARNEIYEIEYSAMQYADRVFPVSHYTKEQIIEHYGIAANKIVPIHNAIDQKLIQRWKHKIPQRIVTFLGRITLQKGPQFLFETATKVIAQYPNVRFVIAGKGDQLMQLVNASAREHLSRYFIFTGFITRGQVDALLAASDVYFMPSVSEPFGLTALEATRAKVPCVLTKQSGASEVLASALKADFWDTDLFAKHILSLLKDESLRQQKINEATAELHQNNWDNSAAKIATEYFSLL